MEQNSLKVFDTIIHYYTYGQGRPLLFIHGHRSDALRWKGLVSFLGQKFKVYAPDLPGFGRSPEFKNRRHTMVNYAEYLNEFVKFLNLKNYILFGGSMGGIIALKMLLQKPKLQPARLILLGTPYDKKCWKLSFLDEIVIFVGKRARLLIPLAKKVINSDFLFFHLLWFCFPKQARKKEIIEYEMKQWRVMSVNIWFETMVDMLGLNFSKEKFQTKIPTLIVNSEGDQYFDNKKTVAGLKKLCPNSKVLFLPFNSHVPKGELKLEYFQRLQPFLEEI